MAKLILKAPYYKPNHRTATGQSRGGYAMYIAKRDGVEIPRSGMVNYIGERRGSHGLFTDEGEKTNLSAVEAEMDSHDRSCECRNHAEHLLAYHRHHATASGGKDRPRDRRL